MTELLKIELARGVAALLPYATAHKMSDLDYLEEIRKFKGPAPERIHEFPPYRLVLTVQDVEGEGLTIASVSAQWRAAKTLTSDEKAAVLETLADCFPGTTPTVLPVTTLSAGFKALMVPENPGPRLAEALKAIKLM